VAVALTDDFKTAINNAMADKAPMLLGSVDAGGQPALSFRGSTQVYSDSQLCIWVRNQDGGLLKSVANNPLVALMYRSPETRLAFQLHGEARRVDDEATRQRVYDMAPEVERNADPERKGTALVIDLLRVIQRGAVVMER
jgi:general stress protein 26